MTDSEKADSRGTPAMLERIRNRRTALGLNGSELARRAGISPSYVSLIERGHKVPNEDVAARLAVVLEDDEDLYRAWARGERYGFDRLDAMQRLDELTSDAQTSRILASGRDLPRPTAASTPPFSVSKAQSPPLGMAFRRPTQADRDEDRAFEPRAHVEPEEEAVASYDLASPASQADEETVAPDAVVEVPVLPAGADPRRMLDATSLPPLHLDARLVGPGDSAGLFAYEVDRAAAARMGAIASEGDHVVLTRRIRRLTTERVYAVRGEDDLIRLGRVLFKGNSLLLLPPAGGTDIEVVRLAEGEPWRDRVLGVLVLTLKRWR